MAGPPTAGQPLVHCDHWAAIAGYAAGLPLCGLRTGDLPAGPPAPAVQRDLQHSQIIYPQAPKQLQLARLAGGRHPAAGENGVRAGLHAQLYLPAEWDLGLDGLEQTNQSLWRFCLTGHAAGGQFRGRVTALSLPEGESERVAPGADAAEHYSHGRGSARVRLADAPAGC